MLEIDAYQHICPRCHRECVTCSSLQVGGEIEPMLDLWGHEIMATCFYHDCAVDYIYLDREGNIEKTVLYHG